MITGYTAQAIRSAEEPLLAAGEALMQRAARALAGRIAERLRTREEPRLLVLAGRGANGGDALHAAAILRREGTGIDVIATGDDLHVEGEDALRAAGGTVHALSDLGPEDLHERLADADLVLDAMVGLGGRPEIPARLAPLLETVRRSGVPVLAVDLPSFVDATTGRAASGALPAVETVTFGAVKAGLLLPGGAELAGDLHLVGIGVEDQLPVQPAVQRLESADVAALWPHPGREASKYTRGVVAIAAGSPRFPGAAVLAASGAARSGAGMVRLIAPQEVLDLVLHTRPEVIGHPSTHIDLEEIGRTQALVVGPGLSGEDPRTRDGVDILAVGGDLERGVIDAGGLDALTADHRFGQHVVLTPHRGEAERIAARLDVDPGLPGADLAPALAAVTGATVLLKGAITLIAPGDARPLRREAHDATCSSPPPARGTSSRGARDPARAAWTVPMRRRARSSTAARGLLRSSGGRLPLVALDVADRLPAALGAILTDALS
ncbi:bifunctional ADP-dependent NAD(P)H-hydrate dehydratase/NAD(P)H-hydrate epimerase [Brachybacterium sp. JB7]|uniref:NAD(P)H-hydrate epimerase n=1 Tax=Brachybacterium sp. JB7 TaxID=2024478 RepID=UPI001F545739|nr:bifunctional ADP-dependent NAD(P)H-hydrate dehydratase/NAD(P)H-hydrate epimerase [Brachybacterium sp. JB7]